MDQFEIQTESNDFYIECMNSITKMGASQKYRLIGLPKQSFSLSLRIKMREIHNFKPILPSIQYFIILRMQGVAPNFIRYQVISEIVKKAEEVVALNQFAQDNLETYVIDRQSEILTNLVTQVVSLPKKYKEKEEREAKSLNHDNMMNVRKLLLHKSSRKCLSNTRKQSRSNLKRSTMTETSNKTPGLSSYMSLTKQLPQKIEQDPVQIERLRGHKQRQQAERQKETKQTKQLMFKSSNKKLVFGYDGNIQFGVQLKNNNLLRPLLQASVLDQKSHPNMNQTQRSKSNGTIMVSLKDKYAIKSQKKNNQSKQKSIMREGSVKIDASILKLVESDLKVQQSENFQKETPQKTAKKGKSNKQRKTEDLFHMASPLIGSKISFTAERIQTRSFFAKQIKERISVKDQSLKQSLISSACNFFVELPKRQVKSTVKHKVNETKKENASVVNTKKNVTIPRILSGNTFRVDTIRQIRLKSAF